MEGTLVLTRFGNKAIEDIQIGDYVLSADPEIGDIAYKQVLNTFVNEADTLTHVTVDGETFTSTATHKVYVVDKGWINACDLQNNDLLLDRNGNPVPVENVETEVLENKVTVYNFEVEDYHTYFVGSGVLVHNENCGAGKKQSPDQKALHDLAEESARNAKNGNPISYEEAQILDEWAKEYNVPQHHPATVGSGQHFPGGGYMDHTHIYNIHVPYVYD